jgi:hypothetical protein
LGATSRRSSLQAFEGGSHLDGNRASAKRSSFRMECVRQASDEERAEQARSRVQVTDRDDDEGDDSREYRMTDDEVSMFETDYGVDYDPYYDDPYTEDELPDDIPFNVDKKYGDRIFDNGEIFYKEKETGLYYRQGAKPRNLSFWG